MALKKNYRALDHLIVALAALQNPEVDVDPAEALSEALGSEDLDEALADLNASQAEGMEGEDEGQGDAAEVASAMGKLTKGARIRFLGKFLEQASVEEDDVELPGVSDPEALADFMQEVDPEVLADLMESEGLAEEAESEEEEGEGDELANVSKEIASARGRLRKAGATREQASTDQRVRKAVSRVSRNLASL